jgi:hypothetical protein
MLLPIQSPPIVRSGSVPQGSSRVRGLHASQAYDFEIDWKCKNIKVGGGIEKVLAYHLRGAGGGWQIIGECPCE